MHRRNCVSQIRTVRTDWVAVPHRVIQKWDVVGATIRYDPSICAKYYFQNKELSDPVKLKRKLHGFGRDSLKQY